MNKHFKFGILAVAVVLVLGVVAFVGTSSLRAETQKKPAVVGFVNVQAVFDAHPQTKTAKATLEKEVAAAQAQMEKEIKTQTKEQQQATMQKYETKLAQREQQLVNGVLENIQKVIKQVADEAGVQVVLDQKNVIYGGQDLTAQVKDKILKASTPTTKK